MTNSEYVTRFIGDRNDSKIERFRENILYAINNKTFTKLSLIGNDLKKIEIILSNGNVEVANIPIFKYHNRAYVIDNLLSCDEILEIIKNKELVIYIYTIGDDCMIIDGIVKYRCKVLPMDYFDGATCDIVKVYDVNGNKLFEHYKKTIVVTINV